MEIVSVSANGKAVVLARAVAVLQAGGLVIFPTETTYGAGVDALNQAAVDKLLRYKARREGKPLSIAVPSEEEAAKYVEVNDAAHRLYERFLPGPVTVVSKSLGKVATGVESEFGTLGIRIPDYPLVLELLRQYGHPVTATSANGSGEKRPYTVQDIFDGLSEKQKKLIDLVIDAGELPHNPPSTVIDTTLSTPVIFRQGDVQITDAPAGAPLISHSEKETRDLAKRLLLRHWNEIKETGLVIGLNGSLGMGKTIFVKGMAEFLNIAEPVTSPTYTYLQEYAFDRHSVKGMLFHLDVWRIDNLEEMERLQFAKLLQPRHVVVIEWVSNVASYVKETLAKHALPYVEVEFEENQNLDERVLTFRETHVK